MLGRRMLLLVALLMGLTALAASLARPPAQRRSPGTTAAPAPAQRPAPTTTRAARVVTRTVDTGDAPVRLAVKTGRQLRLTVRVSAPEAVAIGDADVDAAAPDSPARLRFDADAPGRYPLRLLFSGRRVGVVEVRG